MYNAKISSDKIFSLCLKHSLNLVILILIVCFLSKTGLAVKQEDRATSAKPQYEIYYLLCASERWGDFDVYSYFAISPSYHSLSQQAIAEIQKKDHEDLLSLFAYIKGPAMEMIFGPGPRKDTIWRHGEDRKGRFDFIDQKTLLSSIGVKAEEIKLVVIASTSYPWAGGIDAFPNAKFVIQKKELDRPSPYSDETDIERISELQQEGRLKVIEGDQKLAPGITAYYIGGKTNGNQSISVTTKDGIVFLAGDSVWTYENLKYDVPCPYNHGMDRQLDSYKRVRKILDENDAILIPGTDIEVFRRFPKVTDRVIQIKLH